MGLKVSGCGREISLDKIGVGSAPDNVMVHHEGRRSVQPQELSILAHCPESLQRVLAIDLFTGLSLDDFKDLRGREEEIRKRLLSRETYRCSLHGTDRCPLSRLKKR